MSTSTSPSVVRAADVPWIKLPAREGIFTRSMTFGNPVTRRYLQAQIGRTSATAMSPRHKHTFDQLRYFIEGDAKYGSTVYHPGDCVYFPEGVAYGPQVGYNERDSTQIVLQWGGPSGIYYPSGDEQRAAKLALDALGEFRDGVYYPKLGKPRDGFEAILEHITGKAVVYASARYDAPIRMRTSAFAPETDPTDANVRRRRLARFNECGPDVVLIELTPGGTLRSEPAPADRLYTLIWGSAMYGSSTIDGISCVHVPAGTANDALTALEACTVLVVTFG
jgi:hypothetical protein